MLEYHIFTDMNEKYQQAVVFVVDRTEERVSVMDMYNIIIQSRGGEVRSRLNMSEIQKAITSMPGGNINTNDAKTIFDIFGDLIPHEIRLQHKQEEIERELEELHIQHSSEQLIKAADMAAKYHESDYKDGFYNPKDNTP